MTYRSGVADAQAVVAEIEALGREAVASFKAFADSVRHVLSTKWGRDTFDHLVNNVGQGETASFAQTKEAQFDALFNTHVKGVFY